MACCLESGTLYYSFFRPWSSFRPISGFCRGNPLWLPYDQGKHRGLPLQDGRNDDQGHLSFNLRGNPDADTDSVSSMIAWSFALSGKADDLLKATSFNNDGFVKTPIYCDVAFFQSLGIQYVCLRFWKITTLCRWNLHLAIFSILSDFFYVTPFEDYTGTIFNPNELGDLHSPIPLFRKLLIGSVQARSEEHTSELQSHWYISYAVFCLKKKNTK